MHIGSNGGMGRCLQGNGFQGQALSPLLLHQQQYYFGEGFGFSDLPSLYCEALLEVSEGYCLVF
jgi:hypothetical protein